MKIEENKLQMPDSSPSLIRDRLFAELDQSIDNTSLIVVAADSGYGKTMLISTYLRKKNISTVWYQLGNTDRYAHIFLSYLKAGICKEMDVDASPAIIPAESTEDEWDALLSLLSKRTEPLFLVFDDYQWVDQSPEIEPLMIELINASSAVKVIVISRGRPTLPIARLKVERKYKELTTSDLAFTLEETRNFFNEMNQLQLEEQEIQFIFERTEGWIASYQLILGMIGKMNHQERFSLWSSFPNVQDIYDYLSAEVLQVQPDYIKAFLYKTSLFSELDPVIIDEFLGIDHSEDILNHLLNQHLFVYSDHQGIIRYHRLFRQVLYQNFKDMKKDDYKKEHIKLAAIYESRYELINAFAHYTIGKDYFKAAKVMGLIRDLYNPVESMLLLDGWLEEISAGESFANNTLFLIRCVPLATLQELTTLFEENISLSKKKKNELWLCNLQHRLATIYLMRGDIVRAEHLFQESLKSAEQFHDHAMSALNLILIAEINRYLKKYDTAIEYVRKAVIVSEKYRIAHTRIHSLDTLATIYMDKGNVEKAAPCIQKAATICQEQDKSSLTFIYTTMGRLFSIKGDFTEAIKWGEKAVSIAKSFNNDFDIGWSNHELGESYMKCEKFKEAKSCLEKAYRAFALFTHYQCMVGISMFHLYNLLGDSVRAKETYQKMKDICQKNNFYWLIDRLRTKTEAKVIDKPQKPLVIQTLGRFQITYNEKPVTIKRHSSLRLLQYFIAHYQKKIEKDLIIDSVFPEGSLGNMDNLFNVSLSVLRKTLEPGLSSGVHSRFIKRHGNQYELDVSEIDLDIHRFMELVRDKRNIKNLKKAEELYKGDFLEEYPYETFLEQEREYFRKTYIQTARTIALYEYEKKDVQNCFRLYEKMISRDPFDEELCFEYIELLLRENKVSKATHTAQKMKLLFENEMGICIEAQLKDIFSKYKIQQT